MKVQRYLRTTLDDADLHQVLQGIDWSTRMGLPDDSRIIQIEAHPGRLRQVQSASGITVLPGLTAPANRLSAGLQTWLANQGVSLAADDTVLNVLRKLRDAKGLNFDVDLPY